MALGQNARVAAETRLSNICDSLCGARFGVRFNVVMEEQHLRYVRVGRTREGRALGPPFSQNSFHCCPPRQEVHMDITFSYPKDRGYDFSSGKRTLTFLRPWDFIRRSYADYHLDSDS